jgi:DNA repair/transcription protein MET18/MMS19
MQAMDSEQDPRNLILAFTCATIVVQNFPLGVFVEEMFEVVSCYFPIDFTPVSKKQKVFFKKFLILLIVLNVIKLIFVKEVLDF